MPREVKKEGDAENAHAELREIMKSLDDSAHDGSRYCLTKKIEVSLPGGLDVTYRIMSHLEARHTVQQIISDMCNQLSIVLCQMKKILDGGKDVSKIALMELREKMMQTANDSSGGIESRHAYLDELLLEYINDEMVTQIFTDTKKWYA